MSTPYDEALEQIQRHPGCGSTMGLSKLILSLFNSDCCFSYRECVRELDSRLLAVASRIIRHFNEFGEDHALRVAGRKIYELYPHLWDLGEAATAAKHRWAENRAGIVTSEDES